MSMGQPSVCLSGQGIYENFSNAPGPDGLVATQDKLTRIMDEYRDLSDRIKQVAASFEEGWQGDASGSAQRGAGPLAVEHARASEEMNTGQQLLGRQTDSFDLARGNVRPIPEVPDEPSTMENVFTLGSAQNNYEGKVAAAREAERHNAEVMNLWTNHSSYNERMMPTDYGTALPKPSSVSLDSGGPGGTVGDGGSSGPEINRPAGDAGGTRASNVTGGSSWSPPPGITGGPGGGNVATPPAASTGGNLPGSTIPSGTVPSGSGGSGPNGPNNTGGWTQPRTDTGGNTRRNRPGTGGFDPTPIGGGGANKGGTSGTGGLRGTGGTSGTGGIGSGNAGSRLYGGAGSGTGGAPGSGVGPGRGTGAAMPGS
ncbi:hypothetical protein, partial [Amycolatopsis cihanbeyliensis]